MNIRELNRIAARIEAWFDENTELDPAVAVLTLAALMIVCCIGGFC